MEDIMLVVILGIIAIVSPLVVLYSNKILLQKFFDKDYAEKVKEFKDFSRQKTLSLRLQAAERLILYLERINPTNSILANYKQGMSAALLQSELSKQIRSEFDHNIAQQVYISNDAWEALKSAKEETIKIINIAAQQCNSDSTGIDLSNKVYELMAQLKEAPTDTAARIIKREVRKLF